MKLTKYGFTLTELMVVVIIIAILAGLGLGSYKKAVERSHFTEGLQAVNAVAEAVTRYYYDNPDASDRRQPAMDRLDIALSNADTNKRTCRAVGTQDNKYCARTKYFEVRVYDGYVSADRVKGNNTGDYTIFSYPQLGTSAQQDVCRGNTTVGSDLCVSLGYTNKKSGTNDYTKK